ncbi:U-box domain-containing protein 15-like [Zingiber officinale]|uniref:U-box domain-containing protein 15-like n=1 Tax=Zingiber officinale TaxID=94328 RepID=UPI001C4B919C|nr:U-box domain-containing protein 15-like [Zingiber officinale]
MEKTPVAGVDQGGRVLDEEAAGPREDDVDDLILELLETIHSVSSFGDYRRMHRKECFSLVRWMKLVVPMLEEIKELQDPIPDAAYHRLCCLHKAFTAARKLLRCCHDGSKIYLALESEAVMGRFHMVYEKIKESLDGMPYEQLGITDEVKEQVELLSLQLKRAKRRTDTQDMELAMDLMVLLSQNQDRNADGAILERLAKNLELQTLPDLRAETMAIKKLIKERGGQSGESARQIVDMLGKFKQIAGIEDSNGLDDVALPKYLEKCPSLMIPNDFLCPVTLEIMVDPVIVASGQTYERRSIQKWLDAGHRTCPKSRQILAHLSLAPNYALRNVIHNWCEKNKIELLKREQIEDSDSLDGKEDIPTLVEQLSSIHLDVQRKAVKKIRSLSRENPENRVAIAKHDGIPALVSLLNYPDSKLKEHTVTALLNLSIDELNKRLIAKEDAIPLIIEILKNGTVGGKENSAAALFSLSMLDENKELIGSTNGIPPLVDLLQNGTIRGKKDAATALFNLLLNSKNKVRAINAGIVKPLHTLLDDRNLGMEDEALSIFLLLASRPEGRGAIEKHSFIEKLVRLIKEGTSKTKECAVAVLLELGSHDASFTSTLMQFGAFEHICEIERSGTNRAQRKAKTLLQLMRQCQLPRSLARLKS